MIPDPSRATNTSTPPPHIVMEIVHGERSAEIGTLSIDEPMASISSNEPDGRRRVYLFGWLDDVLGVWEPLDGVDVANMAVRGITASGFIRIHDLATPCELVVYLNGHGTLIRVTAKL